MLRTTCDLVVSFFRVNWLVPFGIGKLTLTPSLKYIAQSSAQKFDQKSKWAKNAMTPFLGATGLLYKI